MPAAKLSACNPIAYGACQDTMSTPAKIGPKGQAAAPCTASPSCALHGRTIYKILLRIARQIHGFQVFVLPFEAFEVAFTIAGCHTLREASNLVEARCVHVLQLFQSPARGGNASTSADRLYCPAPSL